jgi:hypothetical protein
MTQPIPSDLQNAFAQVLAQLRQSFGEDLIGVYALVQDQPHVIAVTETAMTDEQRTSLSSAYAETLNRDIGLTVFTSEQLQEGHPYEADFTYDSKQVASIASDASEQALTNTALLRVLSHRGHVLAGGVVRDVIPAIADEDYRVVLQHDADRRLPQLRTFPTESILHLCRILAFWRIGLVLATEDAGAWSIKNLDPRFQHLIERAATEHQSGAEPGAYNSYQLDQFAEYVRDMLRR